jgi:hypothetical protein
VTKPKKQDGRGRHTGKSHKPWKKSPVIGDNGLNLKPGDNSRIAGHLLEFMSWGPVDRDNIEEMEDRFRRYVEYCIENDIRITNMVAYMAIGIDKSTAHDWVHGRSRTPAHSDFIKRVQRFCASYRELLGADGKLNPVTLIWWQKNYDGFVEKQEIVVTPNNPLGDATSPEEIGKRLGEGIPEDIIDMED